jgi:hypothetical protein
MALESSAVSEYERKRQETIARNKALLLGLANDAKLSGLAPPRISSASKPTATRKAPKKREVSREVETVAPRRVSARIRGLQADVTTAKREAEEAAERRDADERSKRRRVSGDLDVKDIITSGGWDATGKLLDGLRHTRAYQPSFDLQSAKETSDKELRHLMEKISGLTLWEDVEPNRMDDSISANLC